MISIPELWRIVKCFFAAGLVFFRRGGDGAAPALARHRALLVCPKSGKVRCGRDRAASGRCRWGRHRQTARGGVVPGVQGTDAAPGRASAARCRRSIERSENLCVLTSLSSHDRAKRCQKEAWKIFCVNLKKWVAFLRNICYNSLVLNRPRERCAALPGRCGGRKRG